MGVGVPWLPCDRLVRPLASPSVPRKKRALSAAYSFIWQSMRTDRTARAMRAPPPKTIPWQSSNPARQTCQHPEYPEIAKNWSLLQPRNWFPKKAMQTCALGHLEERTTGVWTAALFVGLHISTVVSKPSLLSQVWQTSEVIPAALSHHHP